MVRFAEILQVKAPAGTTEALHRLAETEGKRMADIVRAAIADRLAASRASETKEAA